MPYDPQNVFARILRNEIPSERVYEDAKTIAFMDLMPQAEGHVLVIPREPAETLLDLSVAGAEACIRTTQLLASAVKRAFDVPGIMIMQVNGSVAGQTVPHVHFHIIPKPNSIEGLGVGWPQQAFDHKAGAELAAKLRTAVG